VPKTRFSALRAADNKGKGAGRGNVFLRFWVGRGAGERNGPARLKETGASYWRLPLFLHAAIFFFGGSGFFDGDF
jgi:hypothetical protein